MKAESKAVISRTGSKKVADKIVFLVEVEGSGL